MLLDDQTVAVLTGYMTDERIGERMVARLAVQIVGADGAVGKSTIIAVGLDEEWRPNCSHLMWSSDAGPLSDAVTELREFRREHGARPVIYLQQHSALANDLILAGMPSAAMNNVSDEVRKILRKATGHIATDEQLLHSLVAYCAGVSGAQPYEGLSQFPTCIHDAIAFGRCVGVLRRLA